MPKHRQHRRRRQPTGNLQQEIFFPSRHEDVRPYSFAALVNEVDASD
jgi:hypothetical protein